MEPDVWLRPHRENYYECIAVYACDLLISSKDPKSVTDVLTNKNYFKLKGKDPISYHLGWDFGSDNDDTLLFVPKKHIEIMIDCYYNMFSTKPKLTF